MGPAELPQRLAERPAPIGLNALVALGAAVLPCDPAGQARAADGPRRGGGVPGSAGSPGQLLQPVLLQLGLGQQPLERSVVAGEFLQALGVVGLQPAVLGAPAVVGRLADLRVLGDLRDLVPSASSRSASRSLRMICSGVWRRRFMESSCPSGRSDSHTSWTNLRGSGLLGVADYCLPPWDLRSVRLALEVRSE
jgi:hypothetical protein